MFLLGSPPKCALKSHLLPPLDQSDGPPAYAGYPCDNLVTPKSMAYLNEMGTRCRTHDTECEAEILASTDDDNSLIHFVDRRSQCLLGNDRNHAPSRRPIYRRDRSLRSALTRIIPSRRRRGTRQPITPPSMRIPLVIPSFLTSLKDRCRGFGYTDSSSAAHHLFFMIRSRSSQRSTQPLFLL